MARQKDLHQYRYVADQIIEACRLQHDRVLAGAEGRHDLDFYALSVARLRELVRKMAHQLQIPDAAPVLEDFDADLPFYVTHRDWLMHPAETGRVSGASSFSDSVWRRRSDGDWERLIDVESDQSVVEGYYLRVCGILGDLPIRT